MSPRYGVSVWCRIRSSKDRTQDLCERTGSLQTSENHAEKVCFLAPFLETRAWDVPAPWSGAIPRRSGPQQGFPPCLRATSGIATLLFAAGQRKGGVPRACGKRMSSAATRRHKLLPMRRGASGWWCCVCGPAPPNAGNLISGLDKRPHEMYSFSAFPAPHPSRCPKQRKTVPDVARA